MYCSKILEHRPDTHFLPLVITIGCSKPHACLQLNLRLFESTARKLKCGDLHAVSTNLKPRICKCRNTPVTFLKENSVTQVVLCMGQTFLTRFLQHLKRYVMLTCMRTACGLQACKTHRLTSTCRESPVAFIGHCKHRSSSYQFFSISHSLQVPRGQHPGLPLVSLQAAGNLQRKKFLLLARKNTHTSSSSPAARIASCSARRRLALRRGWDATTPPSARPRFVPCLILLSSSPAHTRVVRMLTV